MDVSVRSDGVNVSVVSQRILSSFKYPDPALVIASSMKLSPACRDGIQSPM